MKINNPDGSTIEHEDEPITPAAIDNAGQSPGWAKPDYISLGPVQMTAADMERIRSIVREEVRAVALEFIRTLAVLNGWITPGAWMKP